MLKEIREILIKRYKVPAKSITLSTNFRNDLKLSSFDYINLICWIEKKYDFELSLDEYLKLETLDDLINYIKSQNRS